MNPIDFHHQSLFDAAEIGVEVVSQARLPAKLHAVDLAPPESLQ